MYREFPYPYPCPLDALTMPLSSNYYILANNMELDLDWNSINMSWYGSHPITILQTGDLVIPGLKSSTVINKIQFPNRNFF